MRIAAVSDDGTTISQHFGRAPLYVVVSVEDGRVVGREKRDKVGHAQFSGEVGDGAREADPRGHGFDATAQDRHARMAVAIADCDVLFARAMGAGAYDGLRAAGIRPVVTDMADIDAAVASYLAGELRDHVEKLH